MSEPFLALHGDMWWPVSDIHARGIISGDCASDIAALLPHIPGRDCIVQAGANVGIYPIALAKHFASVITCEPDPANWACVVKNVDHHDTERRIEACIGAFGETEGRCSPVTVSAGNCGAHRVDFSDGRVPVFTIDGLKLTACDVIWLDVEGSELFALRGARQTIEQFSPTIAVEDKGLDHDFFGVPRGSLQTFLADLGYQEVARFGRDKVFIRGTKP